MYSNTLLIFVSLCTIGTYGLVIDRFSTPRVTTKYSWELDTAQMLRQSKFAIKPDALIARCKEVINGDIGLKNPDDIAEDFVFQFPVVGPLSKEEYLSAVGGFQIKSVFPDISLGVHNIHVDPLQPNRVWYTVNFDAVHGGDGIFGKATGKRVMAPPQVNSLMFNERGQVTKYTGGYVIDRFEGNSGGMGGIFGPLYAIGRPFPFPEAQPYRKSLRYRAFGFVGRVATKVREAFGKK